MAWIVKNSAGRQVEQREEPYLNEALKQRLEADLLPRYPDPRAATLPVLHAIQEEHGYLPHQAIEEAAAFLNVPAADTLDTVTFYEEFFLHPKGRYVIWICQSISCEIMGEPSLTERIKRKLDIDVGETTDDEKFTLLKVECLGSCGTAPVALVNETLHENITPENFDRVLDELE